MSKREEETEATSTHDPKDDAGSTIPAQNNKETARDSDETKPTTGRESSPMRRDRDSGDETNRRRSPNRGKPEQIFRVDREKTCPMLLRVFNRFRGHNRLDDYRGKRLPSDELRMYTWLDATLKELSTLVKEVNMQARRKGTKFLFSAVYQTPRGQAAMRDLGRVINGDKTEDDDKTLKSLNFHIGDYIDLAIIPPDSNTRPSGSTLQSRLEDRNARQSSGRGLPPRREQPPSRRELDRDTRRDTDRLQDRDRRREFDRDADTRRDRNRKRDNNRDTESRRDNERDKGRVRSPIRDTRRDGRGARRRSRD
eukprot:gene1219-4429_t